MSTRTDLRNVAIVAHVDHGKTTLVDAMLWQSGAFGEHQHVDERAMDSNDLEREKGITILAKNTAITYAGHAADGEPMTINIIDTPGHADFGGEVERGLSMVDGVVLLVDASEGPLPQTRFVLRKALEAELPVDPGRQQGRPPRRPDRRGRRRDLRAVHRPARRRRTSQTRLDFPVVYASRQGRPASLNKPENGELPDAADLEPLFARSSRRSRPRRTTEGAPLQAHVTNLDASPFLGRLALLRVLEGTLKKGQTGRVVQRDGTDQNVQDHRAADDRGARARAGRVGRPRRHRRGRRHPGDHDRRDARRPRRHPSRCR